MHELIPVKRETNPKGFRLAIIAILVLHAILFYALLKTNVSIPTGIPGFDVGRQIAPSK